MRIIAACSMLVGLISCVLLTAPVRADQLKMECQAWQAVGARELLGAYTFLFDSASGSLSVTLQSPGGATYLMFGSDVKKWKLLLARNGHAVFYDIRDDSWGNNQMGPVQILSLNFQNPNMFTYWMGGELGEAELPQYEAKCRRLN
jgi:hypothetical protein